MMIRGVLTIDCMDCKMGRVSRRLMDRIECGRCSMRNVSLAFSVRGIIPLCEGNNNNK